ncbi:B12-binding domain-containing radical SAM protein [Natranaerofaba carboxydovora]|uniref:B12-binding domain-containing radical SAM protein n=1 Tax=Natranaerofaba carboxydovora TaxID=2742683 RepID=UPI001F13D61F|nr:radical SAM protein [Natranaerofaba carboxydovora]UMZ72595.1 Hopanoid C-3 methylase [Natranaerofaba carboxydovora]
MRILLIQPRRLGIGFRSLMHIEPLGLEMLAGALEGHELKILDFMSPEEIIREAITFEPDMCGISCSFTVDLENALSIARGIKENLPSTLIFVGGHHAATNPQHFKDLSVDVIALGEGEEIVKDLAEYHAEGIDLKKVSGIVLNEDDGDGIKQRYTSSRPLIWDLDRLPHPRRDLVSAYRKNYYLGLRRPVYALETARGCPYKCKFCSVWHFYRSSYRMKSAKRVFEEIVDIPGDTVLITDDNFFANIDRAYKIGELLKEAGVKKYYNVQARSDDIVSNLELIDLWREVGLSSVFIGFEQIDQKGLNDLNKRNSIKNNEKALYELRKRGMGVTSSFIVDPSYDEKDFDVMLSYIKEKGVKTPSYSILTPLPGTVLYEEMKDKIVTEDCQLYDLLHVVLPTKLPLEKFYKEFAKLWKKTYIEGVKKPCVRSVKDVAFNPAMWFHSLSLLKGMNRFFKAENYLKSHEYRNI